MTAILRATAILGGGSVATFLVSLISAKSYALLLGPRGMGFMGLLQSLVSLAGIVVGVGVGTSLVRMGAHALAKQDLVAVAALRRAAWLIFWVMSSFAVFALFLLRVPVSTYFLGGPEHADSVLIMGVALFFSLASGIQTSTINAYHRVTMLAKIGVLNSLLGTTLGLLMVWLWREEGIVPAVLAIWFVNWGVSRAFLRRVPSPSALPSRSDVVGAARKMLRFGGPYTASMVVGSGVQMILPFLVLNSLGAEAVGYYRAAIALAAVYIGFLLDAMTRDYYPRVSAVSAEAKRLVELINQQQQLVILLAVPIIFSMLGLVQVIVPLLYSFEFMPAVQVLQWLFIGDIFKLLSWTMSIVILARSGSQVFFMVEAVGGLSMLLASWVGVHWFGLTGLGVAYAVSYLIYYLITWQVVRREIGFVWSKKNAQMIWLAVAAALIVQALAYLGPHSWYVATALSFAGLIGLRSLRVILHDVGGFPVVAKALKTLRRGEV